MKDYRMPVLFLILAILLFAVSCKTGSGDAGKTDEKTNSATAPVSDVQPTGEAPTLAETPTEEPTGTTAPQEETLEIGSDKDTGYGAPNGRD